ncbi:MAG: hypothetical protein U1E25_12045 [Methylocystis sp.]
MDCVHGERQRLVQNLRRALPASAHPRGALLDFLRARGAAMGRHAPRLSIVDIFDAGEARGLMCRFTIAEDGEAASFIAPLAQVALARRRPVRSRVARRRQAPPGAA